MAETSATRRDKARALVDVAQFRPGLSAAIVLLGLGSAVLSGIGLTFILPIIELARTAGSEAAQVDGLMAVFVRAYDLLGVPLTLESVMVGVTVVMGLRYGLTFGVRWLREILRTEYVRDLRDRAFSRALEARPAYYDTQGSDEVLNAIITQTEYASKVIRRGVTFVEKGLLALVFVGIALYLSPFLLVVAGAVFGVLTLVVQLATESGYSVGSQVADANERIQETVQTGTQGIREIKLFGMADEIYEDFQSALDRFVEATVAVRRNQAGIQNFYNFSTAVLLFLIIYLALRLGTMSLSALGVFLFAMFRLAPIISNLNDMAYRLSSDLPHLVRTQRFVAELDRKREPRSGTEPVPDPISRIAFEDVWFAYEDEPVLKGVSFEIERGDFVAFVGQSGAGKSTIASLLARLYEPTSGSITADGTPIERFPIEDWRSRIAVVRQETFIFNDTLRYNLTIGRRNASMREIERVCEIAQVTEFLDDLPEGYETVLGENGVQLSGGQKQRVAIARALLKDADILVLDEATSDLDTKLEDRIQSALEETAKEYTTLAIAHRLSTVRNADRIHTIEAGEITESGAHDELLANDGTYSELYRSQVTS